MDDSSKAPQHKVTVSELFCDVTADLSFLSSDYVLFKIHGKHVNSNSAGLAVPEHSIIDADGVQLPESSKTLEILFQFIEPPSDSQNFRQPSVIGMEPSLFFAVAEAAEKYIVYSAMNVCLTRMQLTLAQNPLEILDHCAKHGYTSLADQAADETLSQPLNMVAAKLTAPGVLPKWLTYYNKWREACTIAIRNFDNRLPYTCVVSAHIYGVYLHQINKNPTTFSTMPTIPPELTPTLICTTKRGDCLCKALRPKFPWFDGLQNLRRKIPNFSATTM